jgi:hypothetical protein
VSGSEFAAYRVVKAGQKDYWCRDCGKRIPRGSRHMYGFGILIHNRIEGRFCGPCCERFEGSKIHIIWTAGLEVA